MNPLNKNMNQPNIIDALFEGGKSRLALFRPSEIDWLRKRAVVKTVRGKEKPFMECVVRGKEIQLGPEEVVRQLYATRLIHHYQYPKNRMALEYSVKFGRETKSADIVVVDKDRPNDAYIIVELKSPELKDGKDQLRSYCNATGAPIGIWTNGNEISRYHRQDPNHFENITDLPKASQTLADVLNERFTLKNLILKDRISNERKSLRDIILEMEDEVLANAGVDVFEEVFKLIFTKLYDECKSYKDKAVLNYFLKDKTSIRVSEDVASFDGQDYNALKEVVEGFDDDQFRVMEFRNTGHTEHSLKTKIQRLFDEAKQKWKGVFAEGSTLELTESHLRVCISSLQDVKLFNSNLLVIDEAFEYLVNKSARGEKGQYFTPRHVIDMCVQMLNPQPGEYMIDTASGSCGFPVHTIFKLTGHLFGNDEISDDDKEKCLSVFGIDFDEKAVRVARTLNLIAGDGETNVLHLNTLDYQRWSDKTESRNWVKTYGDGFDRLEKLRATQDDNRQFNFDILMANPPFAGDIKEGRILHQYTLGIKENGKAHSKVGRDILFIERNIDFLKPGGRMAIVLPQGRFNNVSDKRIREFIAQHGRVLAVVGLHGNTFKPHTGTKTSVLFFQKWHDELCPVVDDYSVFFATSQKSGKNNSGNYIYAKNQDGDERLDQNGHLIIDHDLHGHNGELSDGIAEAFIAWAKSESVSFWAEDIS